jgi:DNA gyrase inhibitor GyrI
MFMHDHTKRPKAGYYCPLMKGVCHDGWTKEMGMDEATGEKPVCNHWRGVFINDPKQTPPVQEVFDCVYGWMTDLQQQTAQEVYQNAAATESARNHIAGQSGALKMVAQLFRVLARRSGVTAHDVKLLEEEDRKALEQQKTK